MRYTISLALVFFCGCATSPPADDFSALYDGRSTTAFVTEFPAASSAEAIVRGDHAYRRGELDRALYLYLQAIEADAERPEAFFRVGSIHEQRGKLELAANAFQQVLLRDPEHADAHERLGLVLLDQRHMGQAKVHLEKAVSLDDKRWKTVNALGVIADLEGEHAQAASYFRQALALQPQSPKILTNLAYSLYLADDWAQAEKTLRQALELAPEYELALRNLALLHSRRGNPEQALQLLLKVTGEAQAHNDIGYLCLLDGNHALAAHYFRRAVEVSPTYYELAHRNLKRAEELSRNAQRHPQPARQQSQKAHGQALPQAVPGTLLDKELFAEAAPDTKSEPVRAQSSTTPATGANAQPFTSSTTTLYLKRWVGAGVLNVRDDDSIDARLLDQLRRGRVVRVLREENGWAFIRYWEYSDDSIATREGWVHADFLTENRQRA